jgi:hypothetical protein
MEIRSIASENRNLAAVYGFGSFFRRTAYRDIDILAVAIMGCRNHLRAYYDFQRGAAHIGHKLSVSIDITFLTAREYQERPLLEMDTLIELYRNQPDEYEKI